MSDEIKVNEDCCEAPSVAVTNEAIAAPAVDSHAGDVYWQFLDKLEGDFRAWLAEARAGDLNKSAALRARKQSVVLRASLKEYREVSVAHDKTHGRKTKAECACDKEIDEL